MGQSTNDTFPTAIHVAVVRARSKLRSCGSEKISCFAQREKRRLGTKSSRLVARTDDATPCDWAKSSEALPGNWKCRSNVPGWR